MNESTAATVALSGVGWQPIETAPEKGPALVAWRSEAYREWVIRDCYFMAGHAYATGSPYSNRYYPTHWMPLPAPPATA